MFSFCCSDRNCLFNVLCVWAFCVNAVMGLFLFYVLVLVSNGVRCDLLREWQCFCMCLEAWRKIGIVLYTTGTDVCFSGSVSDFFGNMHKVFVGFYCLRYVLHRGLYSAEMDWLCCVKDWVLLVAFIGMCRNAISRSKNGNVYNIEKTQSIGFKTGGINTNVIIW